MEELPAADRAVVGNLHLRVMEIVAEVDAAYAGEIGLRLEGGTALAAHHLHHRESADLVFFGGPALNARDFVRIVADRCASRGLAAIRSRPASEGFAELILRDDHGAATLLQVARTSPFQLEPPVAVAEGIRVASYRDLCAGKLHAVCDRFEPRDFIDLHAILARPLGSLVPLEVRRQRFVALLEDLTASDPGLTPPVVGPHLERGRQRDLISSFPLRLLVTLTDDEVAATCELCVAEVARIVASGW